MVVLQPLNAPRIPGSTHETASWLVLQKDLLVPRAAGLSEARRRASAARRSLRAAFRKGSSEEFERAPALVE